MFNSKGVLKYIIVSIILLSMPILINIAFKFGAEYELYNIGFKKDEILAYYGVFLSGVVTIIVNKRLINQNYELHEGLYRANNINIKRPYFIVESVSIDGKEVKKNNSIFEEQEAPIKGRVYIKLKNIGDGVAIDFEEEGLGGIGRRKSKIPRSSIVLQEGENYIFSVANGASGYIQYKNMIGITYRQEVQIFIDHISDYEKSIKVFNLSEQKTV